MPNSLAIPSLLVRVSRLAELLRGCVNRRVIGLHRMRDCLYHAFDSGHRVQLLAQIRSKTTERRAFLLRGCGLRRRLVVLDHRGDVLFRLASGHHALHDALELVRHHPPYFLMSAAAFAAASDAPARDVCFATS